MYIRKLNKASNKLSDIVGSPFSFSVSPGAVAPENTIITGQLPDIAPLVGDPYEVFIQEYDRYGNKIMQLDSGEISGNLKQSVSAVNPVVVAAQTKYLGNGSFALSFLATVSGQYSVSIKYGRIDIGAARSLRSPFLVRKSE